MWLKCSLCSKNCFYLTLGYFLRTPDTSNLFSISLEGSSYWESTVVRERHSIPTVDEILHDLNRSTVSTKLDIKWAFHQVELSEESRQITTFATHKGLFRYKRLIFEISCTPEMYQRVMRQVLEGFEGVRNIHDDIIVHEKTAEQLSDTRLEKALEKEKEKEKGLTLNKEKCKFHKYEIEFMGSKPSLEIQFFIDQGRNILQINPKVPAKGKNKNNRNVVLKT